MSKNARISVATCNFNRRDLLLDAIAALLAQERAEILKIHVVDNGSIDGSADAVSNLNNPQVQCIKLLENSGSSGGFYRAIAEALKDEPDYILVLDSDCILQPGVLAVLVRKLEENPVIGVVGPKIYQALRPGFLQELGAFIDWQQGEVRPHCQNHDEAVKGIVLDELEVDYVPACALLVRAAALSKAGSFRPDFFLYWDDIEWQTRIRRAGYGILATAAASVQHYWGVTEKKSLLTTYYSWRNRLPFFREYAPEGVWPLTKQQIMTSAATGIATCQLLAMPRTAMIIERAVRDGLAGRLGRTHFAAGELDVDPVWSPEAHYPDETGRCLSYQQVSHIFDDPVIEGNEIVNELLEDRFGKRLPGRVAQRLRPQFLALRQQVKKQLLALPSLS